MSGNHPVCGVLRVVLEAKTPLSIASGQVDPRYDVLLVRDANDLPMLPGPAIAGVLRSIAQAEAGTDEGAKKGVEDLFGRHASRTGSGSVDGYVASRLVVSHGLIHDQNDRPVESLMRRENLERDPLLARALEVQPERRDHVRLTDRGVADDRGKFERSIVPPGYRFTAELTVWADDKETARQNLDRLQTWLWHPTFRLGGATRRGLGAIHPVKTWSQVWDLRDKEGLEAFSRHERALSSSCIKYSDANPPSDGGADTVTIRMPLKPDDFWRVGQGATSLKDADASKLPDLLPVVGSRVVWKAGKGTFQQKLAVLPGASVKGALAHRTVFHYNRLTRRFTRAESQASEEAVQALFGFEHEEKGSAKGAAKAGHVYIDDVYIDVRPQQVSRLMHNAIDRFSGGVRHGALFEEELLFDTPVPLTIHVRPPDGLDPKVRDAFRLALADLAEGRLALGSASTKGHGYFSCDEAACSQPDWGITGVRAS